MSFIPKKINLDQPGLAKILGSLESMLMEVVWRERTVSVRDARDRLPAGKSYSFNTVMTVMNRLVEKGLLAKKERDGRYEYAPTLTREAFVADVNRSVAAAFVADGAMLSLASFVDALGEASEDDLRVLRRLIDARGI